MQDILKFRRLFVVVLHVILAGLSYYLAFLLRFDGAIPIKQLDIFLLTLPLIIGIKALCLLYFRLYQGLWRYAGMDDLIHLTKATTTSTIIFVFTVVLMYGHGYPRSVFLIDWLTSMMVFGGVRFSVRFIRELFEFNSDKSNCVQTLIIGAGGCGEGALREVRNSLAKSHYVVGFLDDNKLLHGTTIHGFPVIGDTNSLKKTVNEHSIDEVLIAIPSATKKFIRELVESCIGQNVHFKILPTIKDFISGKLQIQQIRNVQVEDLLGRDPIQLDRDRVFGNLKDKCVLVTGAGGSIGSELSRQISSYDPSLLVILEIGETPLFDIHEELKSIYPNLSIMAVLGDIQNKYFIDELFGKYSPYCVFHAAAFKHVGLMENHPLSAIQNNIFGTKNLVDAAIKHDCEKFLLVSTDKAVNPKGIMGAAKRCAELILLSSKSKKTKLFSVRFGNVLGSHGSVIPIFRKQIAKGGPVTITHPDVTRYFLTIPEAVELVLQAGSIGQGGETFLLEMGDPIKIPDLARNMIKLSGLIPDEDVEIKFIGLRPGEKLHEELIIDGELVTATEVPKINVHKTDNVNKKLYFQKLSVLANAVERKDSREAVKCLWDIVDTFDYTGNKEYQSTSSPLSIDTSELKVLDSTA